MDPISDAKKTIPSGTFAGRQLLSIVKGIVELNQFEIDDQVTKTNKLKGITEMIINLDELNNSVNLKDGRPSNSLLTYYVTSSACSEFFFGGGGGGKPCPLGVALQLWKNEGREGG